MNAQQTPAAAERRAYAEADFQAWLEDDGTPALISIEHDRYYAYCFKFGVAGTGDSEAQAVEDVKRLLMRYLEASFAQGCSYKDIKKRTPVSIRLRTWYLEVRTKVRGIRAPLSRMGGLISVPTDTAHEPLVH
jgi:hypothetical protein